MGQSTVSQLISIPINGVILEGELSIPKGSRSLVIFSHGSGSSRFSSRNNYVSKVLHQQKISTLLFDLLTAEEDEIYLNRFNIELLSARLSKVAQFISKLPQTSDFSMGYFGASTGAASAIISAARLPKLIQAVVSRGGRPDLSGEFIRKLKAPTLLIVGGLDREVLTLNRKVFDTLLCTKKLEVIPGATHLFEEPGALQEVAAQAADWFKEHLQITKKNFLEMNKKTG